MGEIDELRVQISALEEENRSLRAWQSEMNGLCSRMIAMLEEQKEWQAQKEENIQGLWKFASINRWRIDSLPYEMGDPDFKGLLFKPRIMSAAETRNELINKKRSISRFGDGEIALIAENQRWNFQVASPELAGRLREVLESEEDGLLIGLNPTFYRQLFDMPEPDADGVRAYMRPMVRKQHKELLDADRLYADALFHNMYTKEDVSEIKSLWKDRACVIIEGEATRSGVGNDLFDACESVERILCPAENAFERYDEILKKALRVEKEKLILMALGPTATILAYDLHRAGYQAIDMGHMDLIYERYLRGLDDIYKVKIPYKYCSVDEQKRGRTIEDVKDEKYLSEIVARIV